MCFTKMGKFLKKQIPKDPSLALLRDTEIRTKIFINSSHKKLVLLAMAAAKSVF